MSDSREVKALCLQCSGSGHFGGHICDDCDGHGFEFIVEVEMIRPKARAHAKARRAGRQSKAA